MTEPADSAAVWDDLKQLVRNVVEEMNRLEDLRIKTGGLDYQLSATDSIVVTKQSLPSMTITISRRPDALEVERILGSGAESVEAREILETKIEESGPAFRNDAGAVFTVEETVYYLLRPFLHLNCLVGLAAARPD
ncbi:MAG TPA: hypothetical protein VFY34_00240 [Pyrinomonadaceae bacterium]|nr:hypothetical protein [Pyrinomonadaceae bacterium]